MITIDLRGPEGNAFALLGAMRKWSKQLNLDTDAILKEAMSGDYNQVLATVDKHFGLVVEMINRPEDEDEDFDDEELDESEFDEDYEEFDED